MKIIFFLAAVSLAAGISDFEKWTDFKVTFKKTYALYEDETERYSIFQKNLRKIENHNEKFLKGETTWEMGITRFADWTEDEFFTHSRGDASKVHVSESREHPLEWGFCFRHFEQSHKNKWDSKLQDDDDDDDEEFPQSVDWREKGIILPPRDIGDRTEHWAFSIAAGLEARLAADNNITEYLSPQFLIDCAVEGEDIPFDRACDRIFHYGLPQEDRYPLVDSRGECRYLNDTICMFYAFVTPEQTLERIVRGYNPIVVTIDGGDLQLYKSGIIDGSNCVGETRKEWSVVAVGTGIENDVYYWIMKNSWGSSWGEEGYFRLIRKKEACGISGSALAPDVGYPTF